MSTHHYTAPRVNSNASPGAFHEDTMRRKLLSNLTPEDRLPTASGCALLWRSMAALRCYSCWWPSRFPGHPRSGHKDQQYSRIHRIDPVTRVRRAEALLSNEHGGTGRHDSSGEARVGLDALNR